MGNHYETLGISYRATDDEIKRAFWARAKETHPDKCPGDNGAFLQVKEAYEVLRSPAERRAYDMNPENFRPPANNSAPAAETEAEKRIRDVVNMYMGLTQGFHKRGYR